MPIIDLTHTFENNMPMFAGGQPPVLEQIAEIGRDGYNEYRLCGSMHVGTHMDAPLHMIENGAKICDLPIEKFFGRGRLVDARGRASVTPDLLSELDIAPGDMVVVLTGWHTRFRCGDYYVDFPTIDPAFAEALAEQRIAGLALDTPSPDHPPFLVHKILLQHDVLIIENLTNVESLVGINAFEIIALPSKLDCEGAAARVVARTLEPSNGQRHIASGA